MFFWVKFMPWVWQKKKTVGVAAPYFIHGSSQKKKTFGGIPSPSWDPKFGARVIPFKASLISHEIPISSGSIEGDSRLLEQPSPTPSTPTVLQSHHPCDQREVHTREPWIARESQLELVEWFNMHRIWRHAFTVRQLSYLNPIESPRSSLKSGTSKPSKPSLPPRCCAPLALWRNSQPPSAAGLSDGCTKSSL